MKFYIDTNCLEKSIVKTTCSGHGRKETNSINKVKPCKRIITLPIDKIEYRSRFHGYEIFETENSYCIKCPNCGAYTDLCERKIPEPVKKYVALKTVCERYSRGQTDLTK